MPIIPATQEAEAGEVPEPGRQRLQWAEITLLSRVGNKKKRLCQKKKKKKKKKKKNLEFTGIHHVLILSLVFPLSARNLLYFYM